MLEPIPFWGYVDLPDLLTDDEILQIAKNHGVIVDGGVYDFIKEILRKAQEK